MITQTAEYALRAVAWLAEHHNGCSSTVQDIAASTATPPEYLSKILQELARSHLVKAQRGPSGGYRLAREAQDISVLDVIEALNPLPRVRECPLGRADHKKNLCPLHQLLDDAVANVECVFRQVSIADLISRSERFSALRNALINSATSGERIDWPLPSSKTESQSLQHKSRNR